MGGYSPLLLLVKVGPMTDKFRLPRASVTSLLGILAQYQHQFYAAAGRTEGSPTRAYMLPGLQHWQIGSDWIFVRSFYIASLNHDATDD